VLQLLESSTRTIQRVAMAAELDSSEQLDRIEELCRSKRIPLDVMPRARLERIASTESHQGVVARATPLKPVSLEDLLNDGTGVTPFLLVCDGLTDPHNLGSLLRTAECAGVTGIVLPRHRAVRITPTVAKVAAGAIEHLRFAMVPGIPTALDQLVKQGVEVIGLAGEARRALYDVDLVDLPTAIVVGSEEKGLAALSRKRCSMLASIPQAGSVASLNASVAGGVALFEVARQRRTKGR
jgi:23S rRNA (guanosine2251-2'-O)-methyltransferase